VAHLKIYEGARRPGTPGRQVVPLGMDDAEWLSLLHLFTAVQTLYISEVLSGHISLALARETATGVLPGLRFLCLENRPASSVEKFVAVRRDSGCPVTIVEKMEDSGFTLANE
jgi:hypothetical protein